MLLFNLDWQSRALVSIVTLLPAFVARHLCQMFGPSLLVGRNSHGFALDSDGLSFVALACGILLIAPTHIISVTIEATVRAFHLWPG